MNRVEFMKFIIAFYGAFSEPHDYYSGKTYIHHGERFPCFCTYQEAKRYTSKKRAENATKSIGGNGGMPKVIEVSE